MDYQALVDEVLADVSAYKGQGTVASYIPALAQVDPDKLGLALVLNDGPLHRRRLREPARAAWPR